MNLVKSSYHSKLVCFADASVRIAFETTPELFECVGTGTYQRFEFNSRKHETGTRSAGLKIIAFGYERTIRKAANYQTEIHKDLLKDFDSKRKIKNDFVNVTFFIQVLQKYRIKINRCKLNSY